MAWFEIPQWCRTLGIFGGTLMFAFPEVLPASVREIGGYAGLVILLLSGVGTVVHFVNKWRKGKTVTPDAVIIIGLIGLIAFGAVALGGVFWKLYGHPIAVSSPDVPRGKPDISWNFDSGQPNYFLGFMKVDKADRSVDLPKITTGEVYVTEFQAIGINNLDEPLLKVSGYIRSDLTNESLPINFSIDGDMVPIEETFGVPAHAQFRVTTVKEPRIVVERLAEIGIPWSKFSVNFASFTFVFNYDGKTSTRHFSSDEVTKQFQMFEKVIDPSKNPVPRVTRKPIPKPNEQK